MAVEDAAVGQQDLEQRDAAPVGRIGVADAHALGRADALAAAAVALRRARRGAATRHISPHRQGLRASRGCRAGPCVHSMFAQRVRVQRRLRRISPRTRGLSPAQSCAAALALASRAFARTPGAVDSAGRSRYARRADRRAAVDPGRADGLEAARALLAHACARLERAALAKRLGDAVALALGLAGADHDLVVGRARAGVGAIDDDLADAWRSGPAPARQRSARPAASAGASRRAVRINFDIVMTSFQRLKRASRPNGFLKSASTARSPPGSRPDRRGQQRIGRAPRPRLPRAVVAMLELLGPELGDVGGKLGIARRRARRAARHNGGRSRSRPRRCRPSPLSRDISAVAAPSAKPATFHSGCSAVGRTRRSAISASKRSRWRSSCARHARRSACAAGELRRSTASWPA